MYAVREHYIVYQPLAERFIAVVAVIRHGRDIPAILEKWSVPIGHELIEIRATVAGGEIAWPTRSAASPRRKKIAASLQGLTYGLDGGHSHTQNRARSDVGHVSAASL